MAGIIAAGRTSSQRWSPTKIDYIICNPALRVCLTIPWFAGGWGLTTFSKWLLGCKAAKLHVVARMHDPWYLKLVRVQGYGFVQKCSTPKIHSFQHVPSWMPYVSRNQSDPRQLTFADNQMLYHPIAGHFLAISGGDRVWLCHPLRLRLPIGSGYVGGQHLDSHDLMKGSVKCMVTLW